MKFLKMLVGLALLFPGVVLTQVLWDLLLAARINPDVFLPVPAIALIAGALIWVFLFALCSKPLRSYILAHELTHALWGLLMGARVSRIRVKKDHGSVVLSKTNFLITLAPYFFPFYTVLVMGLYAFLYPFFDLAPYALLWLGLIGFSWAFHVTLTLNALFQRQTDIQLEGRIFSYSFIYFANIFGVCLWVICVTAPNWADLTQLVYLRATHAWVVLGRAVAWLRAAAAGYGLGRS